ncbi:MAG: hypothetical protein ACXVCT_18920 [Ktedonobacterales bacterium]
MADIARDYSALVGRPAGKVGPLRPLFTALTASLSAIFLGMCWFFYWFMAVPAAITSVVVPRSVLERGTIFWLTGASIAIALLTQTTEDLYASGSLAASA